MIDRDITRNKLSRLFEGNFTKKFVEAISPISKKVAFIRGGG